MKKAALLAVLSTAMLLAPQVYAGTMSTSTHDNLQVVDNSSNIEVVQRDSLPGTDQTVLPTKSTHGKADPAALAELMKSSHFGQLKKDLENGKLIVIVGNEDGRLSDLLLRQAFDPDPNGPVLVSHQDSDPNTRVIAKAIAKLPNEKWYSIFTVYGNGTESADLIKDMANSAYKMSLTQAQKYGQSGSISPNSVPNQSGNTYWYSQTKAINMTNGYCAGVYTWGYSLQRVATGTGGSIWDTQRTDSITPGANGPKTGYNMESLSYLSSVWQSMGVYINGQNYVNENVVDFGPGNDNTGSSSLTLTMSKDGPSIQYQYNLTSGCTEHNRSLSGSYGAWSYSWPSPGSSESTTLTPVVRATNKAGAFWETGDFKVSFYVNYAPGQTYSDEVGDSFNVPDL